ncbi:MAG: aldehyde dehydrogenase family protein [Dermatophilaceae bacterium]
MTAAESVRLAARVAAQASLVLRRTPDAQIDAALRAAAQRVSQCADTVLETNAADVAAAEAAGMSAGLLDRLRLTPARIADAAAQLRELSGVPAAERLVYVRDLPDGSKVYERRVPVGVIGATYEARPAVTLDVASQVLKARSAAVLRTGSAALRCSAVLVDEVLAPALASAGLPPGAVTLLREPGHESAEALVSQPEDIPLVIVRGSGETTRRLSALGAAAGVRVLAHADGGGVLYADVSADPERLARLIRAGIDRLGVCNRLNLLLIHRARWEEFAGLAARTLAESDVTAALPPHELPLGHEWALDEDRQATVTLQPVDGPVEAASLASRETSGIAATVVAQDDEAATAFLSAWDGTGAFWNTTTRLLDGYKLLGVPETGISLDKVPGPRGPVTFPDLCLRQFVVVPHSGAQAAARILG